MWRSRGACISTKHRCACRNGSVIWTPATPSSPTAPPHSVLSQSRHSTCAGEAQDLRTCTVPARADGIQRRRGLSNGRCNLPEALFILWPMVAVARVYLPLRRNAASNAPHRCPRQDTRRLRLEKRASLLLGVTTGRQGQKASCHAPRAFAPPPLVLQAYVLQGGGAGCGRLACGGYGAWATRSEKAE